MAGLFDDLPNEAPAPGGAPIAQRAAPASLALFDDLPSEPTGPAASASQGATADLAALAANGAAFGFGPRIAAGGDTAVNAARGWLGYGPMEGTSPDYAGNLARYQDMTEGAHERHPVAGTVASIAGAAANPLTYLAGPAELAPTLAGKIVQGAGYGATFGAVQGAGDARDLTDPLGAAKSVGVGAAVGAGVGGLIPAAAKGAGMALGRFTPAGREASAPLPGMGRDATDYLVRKVDADGLDAVRNRLQQLGPDAMLVDAGPNLQGAGMALASQPGQASTDVVRALNIRGTGTNARVGTDVDAALGPAQNPSDVRRAIGDTQSTITDPLYADAYGQGQRWTPELDAISQRPAVQSAMQDAATAAANRGAPLPTVMLGQDGQQIGAQQVADAAHAATRGAVDNAVGALLGNKGGTLATADGIMAQRAAAADPLYAAARAATIPDDAMPVDLLQRLQRAGALDSAQRTMSLQGRPFDIGNVEAWDLMKRSLDDSAGAAQRGGQNHMASIYTGLKHEVTQAVDAAVPEYAQARQSFAGHSEMLDALNLGQQAAAPGFTREQVARAHTGLGTDGERQMFRLGLGNAFRENLARAGDQSDFASRMAGNQQLRDKLATVAPSQQALAAFNDHIARAQQEFTQATRPTVQGWHNTLQMLDSRAGSQSGPQQAGTQAAADALRGELGQIPSFARAQQVDAEYGLLGGALDAGRKVLGSGSNAMHPADYQATFGAMSPAEQAANRIGLRADIARGTGVRSNDHQAVKSLLQGDDGWNGQKIATAFGQEAQQALNRTVEREGTFAGSRQRIVENSKTQPAQEASRDLKGEPWKAWEPFPDHAPNATALGLALKYGVKAPLNALARALQKEPDVTVRNIELARAVTAQGTDRSALLSHMEARQRAAIVQALGQDSLQRAVSHARAPAALALARALELPSDDRRARR